MTKHSVSLKVTQASLNQTAFDWPRNMTNIYAAVDEAVRQGSDMLVLEELALTGYDAGDEFARVDNDRIRASLEDVAAYAKAQDPNLIISIGHPWRVQNRKVKGPKGAEYERVKNPLYDRMNMPFNVQTILTGGDIVAMTAKNNLYKGMGGRGYEDRYFNQFSVMDANAAGGVYGTIKSKLSDESRKSILFGRPILHFTDGKNRFNLAQAICEEKWVATKFDGPPNNDSRYRTSNIIPSIARQLGSKKGLVLNISNASPPARDKNDRHVHLNNLASQYADVVLDTDGLGSSGSTFAQYGHRNISQNGKAISHGARMSYNRVATTTSTVTIDAAPEKTAKKAHKVLTHEFRGALAPRRAEMAYKTDPKQAWDSPKNKNRHYEEIVRYTAFWLFDYMRKTGSKGIMEALSGGADSAFNSVMVSVMVHVGMDELGVEKFCDELKLPNKAAILKAEKAGGMEAAAQVALKEMLTAVYMGTKNSSSATRDPARFLIEGGRDPQTGEEVAGIGGKFLNRNVQDLLDIYGVMYAVEDLSTIKPARRTKMMRDIAGFLNVSPYTTNKEDRDKMGRDLRRKYPEINDLVTAADGIAYENIQARGREVLIMLFANKEGKMAVANPNLDEARNAYATFGGDLHSGTINLNGHIPKEYELGIMHYLYNNGVQGVMKPIRALGPILKNKPTAELQPRGPNGELMQNDEDALQRTFAQMDFLAKAMLQAQKATSTGARRLNAGEVFKLCRKNKMFEHSDDNALYNMVRLTYLRFYGPSQHKIHATPICPTFGDNVDHQVSLRTPNLNGQSKDELALLGIDVMFDWAKEDGLRWNKQDKKLLQRRAWQDEKFIKTFDFYVWSGAKGRDYDLGRLYNEIKTKGWDNVFEPLEENHPTRVAHEALDFAA